MLPFETLKKQLKKLKEGGVNNVIGDSIRKNANTIIKMNTDDQLYNSGIDKFGLKLREYKSITKKIKAVKGQRFDHTTLKDTGSFHKNYFISINSDSFEIDSDDIKRDDLFQKYGSGIFGLTDENKTVLQNILKMNLILEIRKQL